MNNLNLILRTRFSLVSCVGLVHLLFTMGSSAGPSAKRGSPSSCDGVSTWTADPPPTVAAATAQGQSSWSGLPPRPPPSEAAPFVLEGGGVIRDRALPPVPAFPASADAIPWHGGAPPAQPQAAPQMHGPSPIMHGGGGNFLPVFHGQEFLATQPHAHWFGAAGRVVGGPPPTYASGIGPDQCCGGPRPPLFAPPPMAFPVLAEGSFAPPWYPPGAVVCAEGSFGGTIIPDVIGGVPNWGAEVEGADGPYFYPGRGVPGSGTPSSGVEVEGPVPASCCNIGGTFAGDFVHDGGAHARGQQFLGSSASAGPSPGLPHPPPAILPAKGPPPSFSATAPTFLPADPSDLVHQSTMNDHVPLPASHPGSDLDPILATRRDASRVLHEHARAGRNCAVDVVCPRACSCRMQSLSHIIPCHPTTVPQTTVPHGRSATCAEHHRLV